MSRQYEHLDGQLKPVGTSKLNPQPNYHGNPSQSVVAHKVPSNTYMPGPVDSRERGRLGTKTSNAL